MALFGKKKEDKSGTIPPMSQSQMAPPIKGSGEEKVVAPPLPVGNVEELSAPPIPGGSLDDIKKQVASTPASQTTVNVSDSSNVEDTELPNTNVDASSEENINLNDDSLFDLSDLDLDGAMLESSVDEGSAKEVGHQEEYKESDMNFINNIKRKVSKNETYFVTTKQFKQLLEIIESVKDRVKGSSDTHLKLLDIKAEEDIEYENLRKDFQFVEEKLYEIDNVIFEQ